MEAQDETMPVSIGVLAQAVVTDLMRKNGPTAGKPPALSTAYREESGAGKGVVDDNAAGEPDRPILGLMAGARPNRVDARSDATTRRMVMG